ncbi:MAG: hypothetical protein WA184_19180 [Stellaceae bacterium]
MVPGHPDRIVPVNPKAAAILKKRSLTNFYTSGRRGSTTRIAPSTRAVAAAYRRSQA